MLQSFWQQGPTQNYSCRCTSGDEGRIVLRRTKPQGEMGNRPGQKGHHISPYSQHEPECSYLNDSSTFILPGSSWLAAAEQIHQRHCIILLHQKGQKSSCNWESVIYKACVCAQRVEHCPAMSRATSALLFSPRSFYPPTQSEQGLLFIMVAMDNSICCRPTLPSSAAALFHWKALASANF